VESQPIERAGYMQANPRIGVVTGLEFESDAIRRRARHDGLADKILVRAGLGRQRARQAAEALLAEGATALLSFGIAGGLDPNVPCETVVIATVVNAENLPALACTPAWIARMAKSFHISRSGALAYAPVILVTSMDKTGTFTATGALAADMESYGVGEAALAANVPFAALRVVADTAGDDLPEIALHAIAPDGSFKLAETLGRVLKSPAQIPGLLRLGRSTGRARNRLDNLAAVSVGKLFFAYD
jgi:adenosylhomocysteine nucleosidase